jgi:hypothetical protein
VESWISCGRRRLRLDRGARVRRSPGPMTSCSRRARGEPGIVLRDGTTDIPWSRGRVRRSGTGRGQRRRARSPWSESGGHPHAPSESPALPALDPRESTATSPCPKRSCASRRGVVTGARGRAPPPALTLVRPGAGLRKVRRQRALSLRRRRVLREAEEAAALVLGEVAASSSFVCAPPLSPNLVTKGMKSGVQAERARPRPRGRAASSS